MRTLAAEKGTVDFGPVHMDNVSVIHSISRTRRRLVAWSCLNTLGNRFIHDQGFA